MADRVIFVPIIRDVGAGVLHGSVQNYDADTGVYISEFVDLGLYAASHIAEGPNGRIYIGTYKIGSVIPTFDSHVLVFEGDGTPVIDIALDPTYYSTVFCIYVLSDDEIYVSPGIWFTAGPPNSLLEYNSSGVLINSYYPYIANTSPTELFHSFYIDTTTYANPHAIYETRVGSILKTWRLDTNAYNGSYGINWSTLGAIRRLSDNRVQNHNAPLTLYAILNGDGTAYCQWDLFDVAFPNLMPNVNSMAIKGSVVWTYDGTYIYKFGLRVAHPAILIDPSDQFPTFTSSGNLDNGIIVVGDDIPGGTLVIQKLVVPDSTESFDFTTTMTDSQLCPTTFQLESGGSQTYDLVFPSGTYSHYGVTEAAKDGFLTSVAVSNSSDPDDLTIAEGETVTVTFTNAKLEPLSGIYYVVPNKTYDTVYATHNPDTTEDVAIPNPFAETYVIGEQ